MKSERPDILTTYRSSIEFAPGAVIKRIAGEERLRLLPTRHDSFINELRIGLLFAHVRPAVPFPSLLAADEAQRTLTFEAISDGVALGEKYAADLLLDDLDLVLGDARVLGSFNVRRSWMYRPPVEEWIDHHREHGHLGAAGPHWQYELSERRAKADSRTATCRPETSSSARTDRSC